MTLVSSNFWGKVWREDRTGDRMNHHWNLKTNIVFYSKVEDVHSGWDGPGAWQIVLGIGWSSGAEGK